MLKELKTAQAITIAMNLYDLLDIPECSIYQVHTYQIQDVGCSREKHLLIFSFPNASAGMDWTLTLANNLSKDVNLNGLMRITEEYDLEETFASDYRFPFEGNVLVGVEVDDLSMLGAYMRVAGNYVAPPEKDAV
jgi:hypothetical protein